MNTITNNTVCTTVSTIFMSTAALAASQELTELLQCEEDVPLERVRHLLQLGADPYSQQCDGSDSKSCALFLCIERDDERLLELLLTHSRGKDLKITNEDGLNALMLAASRGHAGCVTQLLSTGFHAPELLNSRTGPSFLSSTALMLALNGGQTDIAKLLLKSGADPNICDSRGRYPLHITTMQGNLDLIEELKQHGAKFQVTDKQGNTPLHFCVHPHVIECLCSEGVSPNAR